MDGLIYVNKPAGITSFDVVAKMRRVYHTKSVGHTGTLDPQATGVLLVMIGKACKANPYLVHDTKEYVAKLKWGIKYDTGDIWGKAIEEQPVLNLTEEKIREVLASFIGKSLQIPPMYSAIKKDGRKLYEYARENKKVEVEPREIEISEIELLSMDDEMEFRVVCSSGTYIRTLCEDIAEKLGTVGAMSALKRTQVGNIRIEECRTIEEIEAIIPQPHPILQALSSRIEIVQIQSEKLEMDIRNGKKIKLNTNTPLVCLAKEDQAIAIVEHIENGIYRSKRGLW